MMITHYVAAHLTALAAQKIDNPMDGILPDFSAFGVEFDALWKKLIAGIWGLAMIIVIGFLATSFVAMLAATGNDPLKVKNSKAAVMNSLLALAGLAALPVIVGGVLWIVS
jgi:hypothetical protein